MSQQAAHAFVSLLLEDDELRDRLQEPNADIVILGSAQGLCFSEAEFQQSIAELQRIAGGADELSEDELSGIAGGTMISQMMTSLKLMGEMLSNISKTRSEISMTFARNARA